MVQGHTQGAQPRPPPGIPWKEQRNRCPGCYQENTLGTRAHASPAEYHAGSEGWVGFGGGAETRGEQGR